MANNPSRQVRCPRIGGKRDIFNGGYDICWGGGSAGFECYTVGFAVRGGSKKCRRAMMKKEQKNVEWEKCRSNNTRSPPPNTQPADRTLQKELPQMGTRTLIVTRGCPAFFYPHSHALRVGEHDNLGPWRSGGDIRISSRCFLKWLSARSN